jgi:hypothetical protein
MNKPTFELDRSPATFNATLRVDCPDDPGAETVMALVLSPRSVGAMASIKKPSRGRLAVLTFTHSCRA